MFQSKYYCRRYCLTKIDIICFEKKAYNLNENPVIIPDTDHPKSNPKVI